MVGEERDFTYSFEVYEVLIQKWIERESKKHGVREKYESAENYQKLLYEFSQEFALNLYQNKEKRGGYFINHDEILATQLQLSEVEKYNDADKDLKGESLLNRNAEGKYKFAHKSIFEYFLAKRCFDDSEFDKTFNFGGMSIAEKFVKEMLCSILIKTEGTCFIFNFNKKISLSKLRPEYFSDVTSVTITSLENLDISFLSKMVNLKELMVFDKIKMRRLYDFYIYWDYFSPLKRLERLEQLLELLQQRERQELRGPLQLRKPKEPRELRERLKSLLNKSDEELIKELKPINDFLKEMKELEKKLPDCKIYY